MELNYELRAGYLLDGELRVLAFRGHEAISKTYEFAVEIATDLDLLTLQFAVLGHGAMMRWNVEGYDARFVFGVVQSVEAIGAERLGGLITRANVAAVAPSDDPWTVPTPMGEWSQRLRVFKLTLVPRFALMSLRLNSRIFQKMTVREIVDVILDEHRIAAVWGAGIRLEPRTYCVQYRETDLEFVSRLLSEEGIFYYFSHPRVDATVIDRCMLLAQSKLKSAAIGDIDSIASWSPAAALGTETIIFSSERDYPSLGDDAREARNSLVPAPTLSYFNLQGESSYPDEDSIHGFSWKRALTSQCVTMAEKQLIDTVSVSATTPPGSDDRHAIHDGLATMARALAPSGAAVSHGAGMTTRTALQALAISMPSLPRTMAESFQHEEQWEDAGSAARAGRRLQAIQRERIIGSGTSRVKRLSPGYQFTLDHPVSEINANYVIVKVVHSGEMNAGAMDGAVATTTSYSNEFECVPAAVIARPDRIERATQQVLESATVVGAGELESADEMHAGCVKVRFHWDRSPNTVNTGNYAWIPISQPWAGNSYGFQFIPRVGMEVLVSFISGSESLPVIIGTRHHQVAQPPFILPENLTQSGIRTKSITVVDPTEAMDAPPPVVRTERYNQLRFEDEYGAEFAELFSSADVRLRAEQESSIEARDAIRLRSDSLSIRTNSDQRNTVGGNLHQAIDGTHIHAVSGDYSPTVRGNSVGHVAGSSAQYVGGDLDTSVLGNSVETVARNRETVVTGDFVHRGGGDHAVYSEGEMELNSRGILTIRANQSLVIQCGQSTITLNPDEIVLASPNIRMTAKKDLSLKAKKSSLEFSEGKGLLNATESMETYSKEIHVFAKDASLDMSKDGVTVAAKKAVEVDGDSVTLNSKSAGVVLDSNATVQGSKVALKSGGSSSGNFKNKTGDPDNKETAFVLATQILSPGGEPVALEWVNIIDPDSEEVVFGPIQTNEKGEIRVEVPEQKGYGIQIIDHEFEEREQPHDHEAGASVHAKFVTHKGDAIADLEVKLDGEISADLITSDAGEIEISAPPGAYTLDVSGEIFHVHSTVQSHRTLEGNRGYVFVIEPDEPELPEDARANRTSRADQDETGEEEV